MRFTFILVIALSYLDARMDAFRDGELDDSWPCWCANILIALYFCMICWYGSCDLFM